MKYVIIILLMIGMTSETILFDFTKNTALDAWTIVNDGVMGGVSTSDLRIDDSGNGLFSGEVRLENNGGFASIRYDFKTKNTSSYKRVVLRIKGDGKDYQFRIKEHRYDRHSYIHTFSTNGTWQTISIPFNEFKPGFRGRDLDMANFSGETMEEISILIGNKRKEQFRLLIDNISLE